MKCTACKEGVLIPAYLDSLLPCHTCDHCGGSLLRMVDYFRWQKDVDDLTVEATEATEVEAEETQNAILCPKTGQIMTKYRISKDTDHRLDYSAALNAVWMDKGEWSLLRSAGLAHKLNNVFTDFWQNEIRSEETAEVMEDLYRRRFGKDYQALMECREWLDGLDNRSDAIAFLAAEDPFST